MNTPGQQRDSATRLRDALMRFRGAPASPAARWRTELVLSFHAGDLAGAEGVVSAALADLGPLTVLDDVLAPALHDIGVLWERNQITIADEHLATSVAQRLVAAVAAGLRVSAPERETVLLTAPYPERHTTALIMADAVLRGAGFRSVLLGGELPLASLVEAMARHRPAVVAFSSTMPFPAELGAAARAVTGCDGAVRLLVGGACAGLAPAAMRRVAGMTGLVPAIEALLG